MVKVKPKTVDYCCGCQEDIILNNYKSLLTQRLILNTKLQVYSNKKNMTYSTQCIDCGRQLRCVTQCHSHIKNINIITITIGLINRIPQNLRKITLLIYFKKSRQPFASDYYVAQARLVFV